jgi:hypothetical protein
MCIAYWHRPSPDTNLVAERTTKPVITYGVHRFTED